MRKFIINLLWACPVLLLSAACQKPEQGKEDGGTETVEFRLLSSPEMAFSYEGGTDTIFYELKNAVADGVIEVMPADGWAGSFDVSTEGEIVFSVSENTATEERSCTLRVYYLYGENSSLYFDVTVIQEGQPDSPEPTEPPAVGDYFYSDGTYSAELDTEKEPVGIVFWTGDPGKDDAALRKDHPECTNGLVVALDGDEYSEWQANKAAYGKTVNEWVVANTSGYEPIISGPEKSDHINKMLGYNNTKAIEAFNAAPENSGWPVNAVEKVVEYREKCPAPENTSGWYLPSGKELKILCYKEVDDVYYGRPNGTDNKDFINGKLKNIDGAQQLGYADQLQFYRSSTEFNEAQAWSVIFMYGDIGPNDKAFAQSSVRFILAF